MHRLYQLSHNIGWNLNRLVSALPVHNSLQHSLLLLKSVKVDKDYEVDLNLNIVFPRIVSMETILLKTSQRPPKEVPKKVLPKTSKRTSKELPKTSQSLLTDLPKTFQSFPIYLPNTNLVKFLAVVWHNQYGCIQSVGEKHQVQTLLWSMFDVDFEVQVAEKKYCLKYDFELGW